MGGGWGVRVDMFNKYFVHFEDSPFYILPESLALNGSIEMLTDVGTVDDFMIIEGGPLDGLQCGEKMWIIFDAKSPPYYDVQFLVIGKKNFQLFFWWSPNYLFIKFKINKR